MRYELINKTRKLSHVHILFQIYIQKFIVDIKLPHQLIFWQGKSEDYFDCF